MGRKKAESTKSAPVAPQVNTGNSEQNNTTELRYVVVREGHRVSSQEYLSVNDIQAQNELAFWKKVANNHSWGEPVEIVQYDNRLHRAFTVN